MESFRCGELTVSLLETSAPARLYLSWSGRGSDRDPQRTLTPFLQAVLDHALASHASIELRCQGLTYVNAATIGCIVDLVHRCEAAGVDVVVRYDATSRWQKLSFEAMRMLTKRAPRLVVEAS